MKINNIELDAFTQAYIEAALWSSTDNADESGGEPLDSNYGVYDISPETLGRMVADCDKFRLEQAELLEQACEVEGYDVARAGHDFWLTRCGHGVGFWDRDLEEVGDKLTEACDKFGNVDLYVGDDGLIYGV